MSIGIVSALINIGNLVQPLIVGVILDKFKETGEEENYKDGIKKVNLLMCLLDGLAGTCLLAWMLIKPEMINWRKPEVKSTATDTDQKAE